MGILYKTGVDYIGEIKGYLVFYDRISDAYGVVRSDQVNDKGDIAPPHCAYRLETILKIKGVSESEISAFVRDLGAR